MILQPASLHEIKSFFQVQNMNRTLRLRSHAVWITLTEYLLIDHQVFKQSVVTIVSMVLQVAEVKEIGRYDFGSCASLFCLRRVIIVLSFHALGSSTVSHDLLINFCIINLFLSGSCFIVYGVGSQ